MEAEAFDVAGMSSDCASGMSKTPRKPFLSWVLRRDPGSAPSQGRPIYKWEANSGVLDDRNNRKYRKSPRARTGYEMLRLGLRSIARRSAELDSSPTRGGLTSSRTQTCPKTLPKIPEVPKILAALHLELASESASRALLREPAEIARIALMRKSPAKRASKGIAHGSAQNSAHCGNPPRVVGSASAALALCAGVQPKLQELPKPRKVLEERASGEGLIFMPKPAQTCRNP